MPVARLLIWPPTSPAPAVNRPLRWTMPTIQTVPYADGLRLRDACRADLDPFGRLVDLRCTPKPDGAGDLGLAHTHDAAGNILSKITDFGLIQYGHDALTRLVLADYDWKADETFSYDPVGNRTADAGHPVWHYDAANQLPPTATAPTIPPARPRRRFPHSRLPTTPTGPPSPKLILPPAWPNSTATASTTECARFGGTASWLPWVLLRPPVPADPEGSVHGWIPNRDHVVCSGSLEGVLSEYDNSGALIKNMFITWIIHGEHSHSGRWMRQDRLITTYQTTSEHLRVWCE